MGPVPTALTSANYDVTADGARFPKVEDQAQDVANGQINVIVNWTQQLCR